MGQAGDSLARILDNFITLSVPRINLVSSKDTVRMVLEMIDNHDEVTTVRQAFSRSLHGEAIVVFTQKDARDLAEMMDYDTDDVDEMTEQEILMEVTNLLVGAIINGISEILETEISFTAPTMMGENMPIEKTLGQEQLAWSHALLMEVNFSVENHNLTCHLLMFMTEKAIDTLRTILTDYLEAI